MSSKILGILIGLSLYNVNPQVNNTPSWSNLENKIRSQYDSYAHFTWSQYAQLLLVLSDKKFIVLPINEMRRTYDKSAVVVGMRHDIDLHPFKALEMVNMERQFGIKATYYVLPTAEYYGTIIDSKILLNLEMGDLYRALYESGAEIGIHNDLIALMIEHNCDPLSVNNDVLNYFKYLGIPIYGTAAHGSALLKSMNPISNFMIFSDFTTMDSVSHNGCKYPIGQYSLNEYGYMYEAYHVNYNIYLSEAGGSWKDPRGFEGILDKLRSSVPGDRIEILTHPCWWGKR
ncbi:MAG: hypothetical protein ABSA76_09190 [Bacteroidales bacterium]